MDVPDFVKAQLPPAPASVLEVGCGDGALARVLAGLGYHVVAIDPDAPDGEIFEAVALEEFPGRGPFDAVVANRSLHHIPDLSRALDKVARLLARGGRLIVHEHAWDRMDERTRRWYIEQRARRDPTRRHSVAHSQADWHTDHAGLHRYADLRTEFERRFDQVFFAWTPYLYRELGGSGIEQEERALIAAGAIQAIGFNYVGMSGAPPS